MVSHGYLVTFASPDGPRTYVCTDTGGLRELILRLTGREMDSYPLRKGATAYEHEEGRLAMLHIPLINIAYPVHIYSGVGTRDQIGD